VSDRDTSSLRPAPGRSLTSYRCDFAWLGTSTEVERDVLIDVDGERIIRVAAASADRQAADEALALHGLTIPGMANCHSHAFHRAIRGRTQRGVGSFWTWREAMYEVAATLDPDSYHDLATATYAEMALAGITAVGEFHYLHHQRDGTPYADGNAMGAALVDAAREAGLRITLLDACYLHGGIGGRPDATQRRFSDGDAHRWAERADGIATARHAKVGAAIHSVRAVDPDSMAVVAEWAHARETSLHAHVSEQPAENEACLAAHDCTPVELFHRSAALDERFTAVHATHLTDGDVSLLGAASCTCCCCPTTERDLADGIAPTRSLRDAGARLSLGSDSHAVIDLLEEARAVELDERLASGQRGTHDAAALLAAATHVGHASIGWPDAGRIEVGAMADLVTVRLDSVRLAGASADHLVEHVVFAGTAADVDHVVAGGRVVVRDGRHVTIDVPAALARSVTATLDLRSPR